MRTIIALLLLAGLASSVSAQQEPRLAKLIPVTFEEAVAARHFFGQVVAKETVDLAFQVGGQLVELPVIEGETLEAGAVVARLDLEPFQLALDQALAQQAQADRTLARLEQLQGSAVSQVTVDDAQTTAELAAIAARTAERNLEQASLHAPFDALVAARDIANFSTISAGTPIVRLHDMSELRVEIDVPELLFQRAGRTPDIDIWAEFPDDDTRFPLEIREFNAEAASIGQTFRLTLAMEPPEDLVVLPGSSVTVVARSRAAATRPIIPASAIVTANDGSKSVLVFRPQGAAEGTVHAVPIEITPTASGQIEVVSGLESGQEIVASGAALLADGEQVRRFTGFPN